MSLVLGLIVLMEPDPPSKFRPGLDPQLEAICLKAMAKRVEDRYATMAGFAAALGDWLARPAPPPDPTPADADQVGPTGYAQGTETLAGQFVVDLAPESRSADEPRPLASRSRRPLRGPILSAAVGAVALALLGIIIYVATGRGTIRIGVDDANVVVRVDGAVVRIEQLGEPIALRAGEHKLIISRGDEEIHAEMFTVRRRAESRVESRIAAEGPVPGVATHR